MPGLMQSQMDAKLSPEAVQAGLHIPPQLKSAFDRIVLAGMKVMFDPKTHHLMIDELNGTGPLGTKLGKGIAGLMILMWQKSNQTMPPQLIVPAALVLLSHAADFLAKTGQPVSSQDYGEATQVAIQDVLSAFHLDPNKVAAIGARGTQGAAPAAPTAQAPAAPTAQAPAAPTAQAPGVPQGA